MRVDIWSDVVCPFCYVGRARFDKALAGFDGRDDVEVVYHAFELDPSWPRGQTMPTMEMLATKYQLSPADAEAAEGRVAGLARAEGLGFRADRVLGNTFDLHRVLRLAADQGFQHRLLDSDLPGLLRRSGRHLRPGHAGQAGRGGRARPRRRPPGPGLRRLHRRGARGRGPGPPARHQRGAVLRARRPPRGIRRPVHRDLQRSPAAGRQRLGRQPLGPHRTQAHTALRPTCG